MITESESGKKGRFVSENNSVADKVVEEISHLTECGYSVTTSQTFDAHRLPDYRQKLTNAKVAELEDSPNGAEQLRKYPGVRSWSTLTKKAISLHTLYNPESKKLGEGIQPEIYDEPMFGGKSAKDLIMDTSRHKKATSIVDSYKKFVVSEIDDGTDAELGSRDFFKGAVDARAIRTRANEAMEMAADYVDKQLLHSNVQELVSASLACGAAGPVYNLVNGLSNKGYGFSKVILTDSDPMALATAVGLARNNNLEQIIDIQLRNLITQPLTSFIEAKSVDLVDLLGLFEYLPAVLSVEVLIKVREIIRPGGLIIFGNMLDVRPQQKFFRNVVKWPRLQQRSIKEALDIVHRAGFSSENISVRVPEEGVYAVYSLVASGDSYERDSETGKRSIADKLGLSSVEGY